MKQLLVVGGTGFIGRSLCRAAIDVGFSVTSISLNPPSQIIPNVRYRFARLGDAQSLRDVLMGEKFCYVVNCGGYIDHRLYRNGGRELIQSHFDGVQNLIDSLDRNSLIRFVQIGSSDEYGNALAPQSEDMREAPISPYSMGKVGATHFLQMLWRTEKFPSVILRLFLTYGPGQDINRFIPQLICGCLSGKEFPTSKGEQLRDFCYLDDVLKGILQSFEKPEVCGEVINLASGTPVSIKAMIEQVRCIIGKGEPQFGEISYRLGENMALYASIEKAKLLLGWQPKVDLIAGLNATIKFYRNLMDE